MSALLPSIRSALGPFGLLSSVAVSFPNTKLDSWRQRRKPLSASQRQDGDIFKTKKICQLFCDWFLKAFRAVAANSKSTNSSNKQKQKTDTGATVLANTIDPPSPRLACATPASFSCRLFSSFYKGRPGREQGLGSYGRNHHGARRNPRPKQNFPVVPAPRRPSRASEAFGISHLFYVAGESEDFPRDLPLALILSTL